MSKIPSDAPPSYDQATGSQPEASGGDFLSPLPAANRQNSQNGIPAAVRRSMEDEQRPLPHGWIRQFDTTSSHQFYVDTNCKPPRSIWHHPYDDEQYLAQISPAERDNLVNVHRNPRHANIAADYTDEEDHYDDSASTIKGNIGQLSSGQSQKKETLGQKMKDKLTGTTHEERDRERQQRAQDEQRAYERHRVVRQAMVMAEQTGQPQLIGRDQEGHEVYIEPPGNSGWRGGPYSTNPAYGNARFLRPNYSYSRPYPAYGGGLYGGGLGLPLGLGLGGGFLLGGMMGPGMMGGGFGL